MDSELDPSLLEKLEPYLSLNTIFAIHHPGTIPKLKYHILNCLLLSFKYTLSNQSALSVRKQGDNLFDYILAPRKKFVIVAHNKTDLNILLPVLLDLSYNHHLSTFIYTQGSCLITSLNEWKKALKSANIIILTILGLLEVLRHGFFTILDMYAVVLDDITTAAKSHPYCILMKEFILPLKSLFLSDIFTSSDNYKPGPNPVTIPDKLNSNLLYSNFPQIICFAGKIELSFSPLEDLNSHSAFLERQKILQKLEYWERVFQCSTFIPNEEVSLFLSRNNTFSLNFSFVNDIQKVNVRLCYENHSILSSSDGSNAIDSGFITLVTNLYRWYYLYHPTDELLDISDYRGTLAFLELFDLYGPLLKKKKNRFEQILNEFGVRLAHIYLTKLEQENRFTDAVVATKSFEISAYGPYFEENPFYERFIREKHANHRKLFLTFPRVSRKLSSFINCFLADFFSLDTLNHLSLVFVSQKSHIYLVENILQAASKRRSNSTYIDIIGIKSEKQWKDLVTYNSFFSQLGINTPIKTTDVPSNIFKKEYRNDPRLLQRFMKERPTIPTSQQDSHDINSSFTGNQTIPEKIIIVVSYELNSIIVSFLNANYERLRKELLVDVHFLDVPKSLSLLLGFFTIPDFKFLKFRKFEFYPFVNGESKHASRSSRQVLPEQLSEDVSLLYSHLCQIQFLNIAKTVSSLDKSSIKLHPHYRLMSWVEPLILSQSMEYSSDKESSHLSFVVPVTGAYLSILSAPELLSKICSYLPKNRAPKKNIQIQPIKSFVIYDGNNLPAEVISILGCSAVSSHTGVRSQLGFQILKVDKKPNDGNWFVCKLFFPTLFPVPFVALNKQVILGDEFPSKTIARSSACFYAVKLLYDHGVLDSHLLPSHAFLEAVNSVKTVQENQPLLFPEPIKDLGLSHQIDRSRLPLKIYFPIRVSLCNTEANSFEKLWKIPHLLSMSSWSIQEFSNTIPVFYLYVMSVENSLNEGSFNSSFFTYVDLADRDLHEFNIFNSHSFSRSFGILLPHKIDTSMIPPFNAYFLSGTPCSRLKIDGPNPISLTFNQLKSLLFFQISLFKTFTGFKNTLLFDSFACTEKDVETYLKSYLASLKINSISKNIFLEEPILDIPDSLKVGYLVAPVTKISANLPQPAISSSKYPFFLKPQTLFDLFISNRESIVSDLTWNIDWPIVQYSESFFAEKTAISLLTFISDLQLFYTSQIDNYNLVDKDVDDFIEFSLKRIIAYHELSDIGYQIKKFRPDLTPKNDCFSQEHSKEPFKVSVEEYIKLRFNKNLNNLDQPLVEGARIENPNTTNFSIPRSNIGPTYPAQTLSSDIVGLSYATEVVKKVSERSSLVMGKSIIALEDDQIVYDSISKISYSLTTSLTLNRNQEETKFTCNSDPETSYSFLAPEILTIYPLLPGQYFLAHIFPTWFHQFQRCLLILELYQENEIMNALPVKPEPTLFIQALTCPVTSENLGTSLSKDEQMEGTFDYERLELLGDSLLKYAVTLDLFLSTSRKILPEDELTRMRSKIISNSHLFTIGILVFSFHKYANISGYILKSFFPPHISKLFKWILQEIPSTFSCSVPIRPIFDECISWLDLKSACDSAKKKDLSIFPFDDADIDNCTNQELQAFYANSGALRQLGMRYSNKTISDMVESVIGSFYISTGLDNTLSFLKKLGLVTIIGPCVPSAVDMRQYINFNLNNANCIPENLQLFENVEHRLFDKIEYINAIFVSSELSSLIYSFDEIECKFVCTFSKTLEKISSSLKYNFKDPRLALLAFVHPSLSIINFERLEFLGDSVLDFLITRYFYEKYPFLTPNDITVLKSTSVDNESFSRMLVLLQLEGSILFGNDSESLGKLVCEYVEYLHSSDQSFILDFKQFNRTQTKLDHDAPPPTPYSVILGAPKILGDVFESLAGAVFLDLGCDLEQFWNTYKEVITFYLDRNSEYKQIGLNPMKDLTETLGKLGVTPNDLTFEFQNDHSSKVIMHRCIIKLRGITLANILASTRNMSKRIAAAKALQHILQGGYKEFPSY